MKRLQTNHSFRYKEAILRYASLYLKGLLIASKARPAPRGSRSSCRAGRVPRGEGAAEGCGYLLSVVYRADQNRSDLVILDAEQVEREPLATVQLPHRVPGGFHGNWRPAA